MEGINWIETLGTWETDAHFAELMCEAIGRMGYAGFFSAIGTWIDGWCGAHDKDPAEFIELLAKISKEVNETEGAFSF